MSFTGYCTTEDLAKFLDIGYYTTYTISSYDSTESYSLPTTSGDGITGYLVEGMISATDDGAVISESDYSVNLNTGDITFSSDPADTSEVIFTYYLASGLSNADLEYYIELGAYELERDTHQIFRELSISGYETDANEYFDYVGYDHSDKNLPSKYVYHTSIQLPYAPILSVSSLDIDGTDITTSSLKLEGNRISLTNDSEVTYFTKEADTVTISFTYGITETAVDQSEDDKRLLKLANETNKYAAVVTLSQSPTGRNILLENSKLVSLSDGQIRPETLTEDLIIKSKERYDELIDKLKAYTSTII